MKFLNFLRAFFAIVITCSLLLFWYSSEKQEPESIPTQSDDFGDSEVQEEAPLNLAEILNGIDTLENKPLDTANNRLYEYLSTSSAENPKASYFAYNLSSGEYYTHNPDIRITGASVIKSAYCFYILNSISEETADFDEILTYYSDDLRKGTGIIKDSPIGTEYTVKELITLSITESDNIAHKMLVDRFGRPEFNQFLDNLGIESMHLYAGGEVDYYNNLSSRDLTKLFTAIYYKSFEDENISWYLDILTTAKFSRFEGSTQFKIAHKSGFMKGAFHDAAIILADEPYILIVLTNGNITEKEELFLKDISSILCREMENK